MADSEVEKGQTPLSRSRQIIRQISAAQDPQQASSDALQLVAFIQAASTKDFPPNFEPTQFAGAFWTTTEENWERGFDELKQVLQEGNDFCRDAVAIFRERSVMSERGSVSSHWPCRRRRKHVFGGLGERGVGEIGV